MEGDITNVASVLQVGQNIKPEIPSPVISELATRLYGLTVLSSSELNSYDDRNYHIFVDECTRNPNIKHVSSDGYVLKILNSLDSKKSGMADGQHAFMEHLRNDGICTSCHVLNVRGEFMSLEKIDKDIDNPSAGYVEHVVRLFAFIPATIMVEVPYTPTLMFEAGKILGRIHLSAKCFHHPFFDIHKTVWNIIELPKLKDFVHVVEDASRRQMVEEVLEEFDTHIVPKYNQLRKGMIHGDPNEQNILLEKSNDDGQYHVFGVLDFSDTMLSYSVFDIAKMIAYHMLDSTSMDREDIGGHVIAGYDSVFKIPEIELELIIISAKARLCQTLVLGQYTYSLTPENTYLLTTAIHGWDVLRNLHFGDSVKLFDKWMAIKNSYGDGQK